MGAQTDYLDAASAGGMVDGVEKGQLVLGVFTELRNVERQDGTLTTRRGWKKANASPIPVDRFICGGCDWYRDGAGNPHWLAMGNDGHLYHCADETGVAWALVSIVAEEPITWDGTHRASFADWGDDCLICVSQPQDIAASVSATAQNLRFDGLSSTPALNAYKAYGISIQGPTTAPTAADNGAGDLAFGTRSYKVTFKDVDTGFESAPSPVATITLARPDGPDQATMTATPAAGGALPAGTYLYGVTFIHATNGIESLMGPVVAATVDGTENVALAGIPVCPETTGTWYRRIYRSWSGGAFYLLTSLNNNTTVASTDSTAATPPSATLYTAPDKGRVVRLTAVPIWAGTGRTIHRCIYCSVSGATYAMLVPSGNTDSIDDNATTTYDDADATPTGATFSQQYAVPPMALVATFSDRTPLYAGDRANNRPARCYLAASDENPESLALLTTAAGSVRVDYAQVGDDSDWLTALAPVRDSVFAGKTQSVYIMGRRCKTSDCRRIVSVGCVNNASVVVVNDSVVWLSNEGPRLLTHYASGKVIFCGETPNRFALAETWGVLVKDRLPYATGVHWQAASCVLWFIQACDSWPISPEHNDLCIVWDYGTASEGNPGGKVWLLDIVGADAAFTMTPLGCNSPLPYAGFAFGWISKLFEGDHGDGTTQWLSGTVLGVSGNLVNVDVADLQAENVVGSTLWIRRGTAQRTCRPISVCENVRSLIVAQCGGQLTLAGDLGLATDSQYTIGGFRHGAKWMMNNKRDPDSVTRFVSAHIQRV